MSLQRAGLAVRPFIQALENRKLLSAGQLDTTFGNGGIVEADETYIGGKPRVKNSGKRGRGTKKAPVMVLVQRDGDAVCMPIPNVTGKTLSSRPSSQVQRMVPVPEYCRLIQPRPSKSVSSRSVMPERTPSKVWAVTRGGAEPNGRSS